MPILGGKTRANCGWQAVAVRLHFLRGVLKCIENNPVGIKGGCHKQLLTCPKHSEIQLHLLKRWPWTTHGACFFPLGAGPSLRYLLRSAGLEPGRPKHRSKRCVSGEALDPKSGHPLLIQEVHMLPKKKLYQQACGCGRRMRNQKQFVATQRDVILISTVAGMCASSFVLQACHISPPTFSLSTSPHNTSHSPARFAGQNSLCGSS